MRKISSLTALISFVLLLITSIILYIVPAGRVTYWANWRLGGLSKEQWGAVHINLGFLLLVAILLHSYYNWGALVSYLKNAAKQFRLFTREFNIALLITLIVCVGTLSEIPPFSSVIQLGASISDKGNRFYGEPPYGHAEMSSLADFADKIKVDLDEGVARLRAAGFEIAATSLSVAALAEKNGVPPQRIYEVMKPELVADKGQLPENPPGGTGQRRLLDLCEMYSLNVDQVLAGLAAKGIAARSEQTMKEIAAANGTDPHGVYAMIYALSRM